MIIIIRFAIKSYDQFDETFMSTDYIIDGIN